MADDEPTCGKGLAEHSVVPLKLAGVIDALADNLERHVPSLSSEDAAGLGERLAYTRLAAQHREIAARLRSVADEMAGYRDLPMAPHDMNVLGAPEAVTAFESYIAALRQAIATLQATLTRDEALA